MRLLFTLLVLLSIGSGEARGTALPTSKTPSKHHSPVFEVSPSMGVKALKGYIDVHFDETLKLTFAQIRSGKFSNHFRSVGPYRYNRPLRPGVIWFRVLLNNRTQKTLRPWLQFRSRLIDDLSAFIPDASGSYRRYEAGHPLPLTQRILPHPNPRFPLTLRSGEQKLLYFRIYDEGTIRTGIEVGFPTEFMRKEENRKMVWGAMFGAVFLSVYICLILLIRLRSSLLLWFFFTFVSIVCLLLFPSDFSYSWSYTWRAWWINRLIMLFISFGAISTLFGFATLMKVQTHMPRVYRYWRWFWVPCLFSALSSFIIPFWLAIHLSVYSVIPSILALMCIALILSRKSDRIIRLSAFAMVFMMATVSLQLGRILNWISETEISRYISFSGMLVVIFLMTEAIVRLQRGREREEDRRILLEKQNEDLLRLDKMKDEFLANTSHELRTPLGGIIGLAESILGPQNPLDEGEQRKLQLIVSSGRRLSSLIDDILDFSKIRNESIQLQQTPVDLHKVVELVCELQRPMLRAKSVDIHNQILVDFPLFSADENRLQQILHNLVGNAIKFTHEGHITIKAQQVDGMVHISVEDTGIGIAKADLARVFLSFEQGDGSIEREYGGTGLGLSVAKQLVELHGGEIDVTSSLGSGSTFHFTLPLTSPAQSTMESKLRIPRQSPKTPTGLSPIQELSTTRSNKQDAQEESSVLPSLLLVDDEPINLEVLREHLSQEPYHLIFTSSGIEAMEMIEQGLKPSLVVLDVMMPRMSGFEVCEKLRERFSASTLPILMLTAKSQTTDLLKGFAAGANDYITKPFSKNELLARIRTHLGLSQFSHSAARFVPFSYIELLGKESLLDVEVGDHKAMPITILFSDIRSYTTLTEEQGPLKTFSMINNYFERMESAIHEQHGFIDSYIGDAIMALFAGSPDQAVHAAITMQQRSRALNKERETRGEAPLQTGIGIHSGDVILGIVGSSNRHKCGVVGDSVNMASRVESLTKYYQAPLLISDSTKARLSSAFRTRLIDRVMVKGKNEPASLYEVLDALPPNTADVRTASLVKFSSALDLLWEGAWKEAYTQLQVYLEQFPEDPVAKIHIARLAPHVESGPPEDWKGAYKLDFK